MCFQMSQINCVRLEKMLGFAEYNLLIELIEIFSFYKLEYKMEMLTKNIGKCINFFIKIVVLI